MHFGPENETCEYKARISTSSIEKIKKSVVAFLNCRGGDLYIGVDDNGKILGLENIDASYTQLTNTLRDSIQPACDPYVECHLKNDEGKQYIHIAVKKGNGGIYFLSSKGLEKGVFIRQGASTVLASKEYLIWKIRYTETTDFENAYSFEQQLSFDGLAQAFQRNGLHYDASKNFILGIQNTTEKYYTNFGLLLSDQNPYQIKIGYFNDIENTRFQDSLVCTGDILTQVENAFAFLKKHNNTSFIIKELQREEHQDYPLYCLREGLLNAVIHRDYTLSMPIMINMNKQSIEFLSPGNAAAEMNQRFVQAGFSTLRNEHLANLFFRLHYVEAFGTGLRRIWKRYRAHSVKPNFETGKGYFRLTLPSLNNHNTEISHFVLYDTFRKTVQRDRKSTSTYDRFIDFMQKHREVHAEDVRNHLRIGQPRLYQLIQQLKEEKYIRVEGRGVNKIIRYIR